MDGFGGETPLSKHSVTTARMSWVRVDTWNRSSSLAISVAPSERHDALRYVAECLIPPRSPQIAPALRRELERDPHRDIPKAVVLEVAAVARVLVDKRMVVAHVSA